MGGGGVKQETRSRGRDGYSDGCMGRTDEASGRARHEGEGQRDNTAAV